MWSHIPDKYTDNVSISHGNNNLLNHWNYFKYNICIDNTAYHVQDHKSDDNGNILRNLLPYNVTDHLAHIVSDIIPDHVGHHH